jgi:glycosyltransferase involved in cell wall biosynthesis
LVHVHAIFSYASTRAMRTARTQRVPYVCRPLGQLCEWSLRQRALKKRAYLALFEKANLDAAAAIHYTTRQEEAEARPLRLACPAFVLPHGVDLPARMPDARAALRQRLGLPSEARVVLFLSRLHTKKGLECLIPALARLRDDSFWFVLVGDAESPEYEAQVQALLQATGLLARTRRVPFATGEWKQALLQGADLFALTSHSENFGLAVLEAMGAGLPVLLTSGVALAQEVARHQAGEIVPMNQAAVADAARRLLADSGLRLSLGAAGRRLVEREYAWPSVATRLTEEYRRITSQTASTR